MGFYGKKLIRRLQEKYGFELPSDIRIQRCDPGWSIGKFKWTFRSIKSAMFNNVGSQYTVRKCAMAKTVTIEGGEYSFINIDRDIIPITPT